MGRDISIHLEFRDVKSKKFKYGGSHNVERIYRLFDLFVRMPYAQHSNHVFCKARGLPGDITNCTYKAYKEFGDVRNPGWLITSELKECLDVFKRNVLQEYKDESLLDCIKHYEILYDYMNDHESHGEECRIVFWFDQ